MEDINLLNDPCNAAPLKVDVAYNRSRLLKSFINNGGYTSSNFDDITYFNRLSKFTSHVPFLNCNVAYSLKNKIVCVLSLQNGLIFEITNFVDTGEKILFQVYSGSCVVAYGECEYEEIVRIILKLLGNK